MLPLQHRLKRKRDFARIYRTGKMLRTGFLRIHTAKNDLEVTRIGFVVANKVIRSAVQRNRVKRQLRAAVQPLLPRIIPGYDIIISVTPAVNGATFPDLAADLEAGLTKIYFLQ